MYNPEVEMRLGSGPGTKPPTIYVIFIVFRDGH